MRVAPRVLACTSRSALVCPGATVTRDTAEATEGTLLVMSTTKPCAGAGALSETDRKSTRLNSSHLVISYAVFCLKKKKTYLPAQFRLALHSYLDRAARALRAAIGRL